MNLLDEFTDLDLELVPELEDIPGMEEISAPKEFVDTDRADPLPKAAPRRGIRPEAVLAILAGIAAVGLAVMLILCLPYLRQARNEDPETDIRSQRVENTLPTRPPKPVESTQPTVDETVPSIEEMTPPEANPYGRLDFQYDENNYLYCLRQDSYVGVDVSAFQGDIDWQKVQDSGVHFAMLRLGYRGYESGKLVEDEYIQQNLERTAEVGMPIGAYFFSQALNVKEVDEEIEFMLEILGDYELHMPIVLDWEIPAGDKVRTRYMDARTLTAIQEYFCQTMEEKGFVPMVYFNWHQSNTLLYLNELERYPFWLALYTDRMNYPYHVEMWQYTDSGRVPGIQGNVDLNVYMPKQTE